MRLWLGWLGRLERPRPRRVVVTAAVWWSGSPGRRSVVIFTAGGVAESRATGVWTPDEPALRLSPSTPTRLNPSSQAWARELSELASRRQRVAEGDWKPESSPEDGSEAGLGLLDGGPALWLERAEKSRWVRASADAAAQAWSESSATGTECRSPCAPQRTQEGGSSSSSRAASWSFRQR